jgi:hypothetical protein
MRRLLAIVGLAGVGLFGACGGSSSETPWPVEPIDHEPGPEGENLNKGNVIDVKKLPDNYNAGGAGSESGDEGGGKASSDDE